MHTWHAPRGKALRHASAIDIIERRMRHELGSGTSSKAERDAHPGGYDGRSPFRGRAQPRRYPGHQLCIRLRRRRVPSAITSAFLPHLSHAMQLP